MSARIKLPHDRGHLLWSADTGASRMLLASIDRWTNALLSDDGIDMPLMGEGAVVGASILARENGIIAGTAVIDHLLQIWAGDVSISWHSNDGRSFNEGDEVARLKGPKNLILALERTILNILGQLSGIATETKRWSAIAPRQIACTRKTTWGLLDKWAVYLGGGLTHRLNRLDAVLIKENDLASMFTELDNHVTRISKYLSEIDYAACGGFLEIEVQNEKEAIIAAFTWSEKRIKEEVPRLVVMLDNFTPEQCKKVTEELAEMGLKEHVFVEVSGGIRFNELKSWRLCGADVISTSAINRGTNPLDLTMLIDDM